MSCSAFKVNSLDTEFGPQTTFTHFSRFSRVRFIQDVNLLLLTAQIRIEKLS